MTEKWKVAAATYSGRIPGEYGSCGKDMGINMEQTDYREAYEQEHLKCAELAGRIADLEAKNEELEWKLNRIKKALHDILGDEEQTEKAFAIIAKKKYNVSFLCFLTIPA